MTAEAQHIALAEACGWRGISPKFLVGYAPWRKEPYSARVNACPVADLDCIPRDPLPDYPNDLNVIREAEKQLLVTRALMHDYALALTKVCTGYALREFVETSIFADASQRLEALLKTLNLWKP